MDDKNQNPTPINPAPPASPVQPTTPPPAAGSSFPNAAPMTGQSLNVENAVVDDTETGTSRSTLQVVGDGFRAIFGGIFSWILFPVAIVLILHFFVFQAYHVLGTSMVGTLHDGDYLIISKVSYTEALIGRAFGENKKYIPKRGQVIVFHYPKDPTKIFVKRVVALPGERVVVKNGAVTVFNAANPNGFNPDVKYEAPSTATLIDTDETVEVGNVFVLGDNRTPGGSYDSREWGELPSSYIIGDVVLRLLPLDQIKIF